MLTNRFLRNACGRFVIAGLLATPLLGWDANCSAQPGRRAQAAPATSPFGPPPRPIGPAPLVPIQEFDPRTGPPAGRGFPGQPRVVRRATPFDPNAPVAAPPVLVDPQTAPLVPVASPTMVESPVPIGNLRVTASESFLNRVIARDETTPGEVRDFILGAQVSGHQTTATHVQLDLVPSATNARGALVLNGKTQSETTGVTPQAKVDVASQQEFVAFKEIFFDGNKFSTKHAVVSVRAKNQTLGAMTPLTGTLFGGIANRIAYREAERRRPQAEAIARDRVAERVYPEFDTAIDKQLATANEQLEVTVQRMLKAANLMPLMQQVSTTDTTLSYCVQLATDAPTMPSTPLDDQIANGNGLNILVHESLLNAFVGRAGLKGLKTTDRELAKMMAPYEFKSSGDELEKSAPPIGLPGMDSIVTDVEFDDDDPLTIRLERGLAVVTIRAKIKPAGQDVIPALELTIPYSTELVGDKIVVTPGKVNVKSRDNSADSATPGLAMKMISEIINANLEKFAVDRVLPSSVWPAGGPAPRVVRIVSDDGWAAISID